MKHIITIVLLLFFSFVQSQNDQYSNGLFYKFSFSTTLTTNDDYTIGDDNNGTLINLNGLFFNNSVGYQFDRRSSLGLNIEYDRFIEQGLNFLPIYLDFTYNIFDFDDQMFIRGGYGKMISLGSDFKKGSLYKIGAGYRIYDGHFKNSGLIGFDFSRRRFDFREEQTLSSFAIFLEFILF